MWLFVTSACCSKCFCHHRPAPPRSFQMLFHWASMLLVRFEMHGGISGKSVSVLVPFVFVFYWQPQRSKDVFLRMFAISQDCLRR